MTSKLQLINQYTCNLSEIDAPKLTHRLYNQSRPLFAVYKKKTWHMPTSKVEIGHNCQRLMITYKCGIKL